MKTFGKCKLAHTHTHHHTTASWSCKACNNIEMQCHIVSSSFNLNSGSGDTAEELEKQLKKEIKDFLHTGEDSDAAHRQQGQLKLESVNTHHARPWA